MVEKRAVSRIQIPEATVSFKRGSRFPIIERFSRPYSLQDITKSGLCFESPDSFKRGELVHFDIRIPGEKTIRIEANVCWTQSGNGSSVHRVGAQFRPFGKGIHMNSMRSLETLRVIETKYRS